MVCGLWWGYGGLGCSVGSVLIVVPALINYIFSTSTPKMNTVNRVVAVFTFSVTAWRGPLSYTTSRTVSCEPERASNRKHFEAGDRLARAKDPNVSLQAGSCRPGIILFDEFCKYFTMKSCRGLRPRNLPNHGLKLLSSIASKLAKSSTLLCLSLVSACTVPKP